MASLLEISNSERRANELDILQAMYPGEVFIDPVAHEVRFSQKDKSCLVLRLPDQYPEHGYPDIILANDGRKNDLRTQLKEAVGSALLEGNEALDTFIVVFRDLIEQREIAATGGAVGIHQQPNASEPLPKTVIIWLHHLLATSKRKLALSPADFRVSGITKPGYPGVMIFTGPATAVGEHVGELKRQNWQAFQIRYENDVKWQLCEAENSTSQAREGEIGVVEVETMAEVVKLIENDRREEFLKAIGVK